MNRSRTALKSDRGGTPASVAVLAKQRRATVVAILVLGMVTSILFLRTTTCDFVNYDDPDYVTSNRHVQGGLTLDGVKWAFKTGHASNWHPLTWVSHMLDCQWFGMKPGAHHAVNLALHVANTLLVFLLFQWATGFYWRSILLAAVFGWHPLRVESVAWISERKDLLSAFFFLLTLLCYSSFVRSRQGQGRVVGRGSNYAAKIQKWPPAVFYLLALWCFALGLLSKPMLVTLPFLLLLLDYWPFQRVTLSAEKGQLSVVARLVIEKVPFFLLCVASSWVTLIVQQRGGAVSTSLSLAARIENAVVSYTRYLTKWGWPHDLSVLYPHPGKWPYYVVVLCAGLFVVITIGVLWSARKRPYFVVGWFWFVGMMIPVIGLVQVGIQSMADRYTYLPMLGVSVALIWGLADFARDVPRFRPVLIAGGGAALVVWSMLTVRQVEFWRDSEALFSRAVQVTRDNYLAYNNLGYFLSGKGKAGEAMEHYRKSLEINPNYEDALNNLGHALAAQGKHADAIAYYERALNVRPGHVEVHNNLGNALAELGRVDEAMTHYYFVIKQRPDHADAHNNLGIALAMKGRLNEAIAEFQLAIRYKPNYAGAHSNLGNAYAVQRKLDEAIREFRTSLELNPKDAQAHNNLGNVLAEQGKTDEAIVHYREAIQLNPANPEANCNLAILLARIGKPEQARKHLAEALRLRPNYPEALRQLQVLDQSL